MAPENSSDTVDLSQLGRDVEAMASSHRSLSEWLRSLDPVDPVTPSSLPDWTVGHVLTHIARNADSALRMLDGLSQYWKGWESRDADIELGAHRSWAELVDDIHETSDAVEARMDEVVDWTGSIHALTAVRPKVVLPITRRREVEIHRADLGLGYGFADMPDEYVRGEIRVLSMVWTARQPMGLTSLPEGVLALAEHDRLAWLMGRLEVPGVDPARIY